MIKALIFDIDNTLYDYDAAHEAAFQALAEDAGRSLGLSAQQFSDLHREANRIQQARAGIPSAAIHNRLIRYQIMLEQIGEPISRAPQMSEIYWSTFLAHMRLTPGAEECLSFLKEACFMVGIGTNMTADYQYAKLERLGLLRYVDFMVTSEEAGTEKPDSRFFALCVEKAGCSAGECVFVGDSLRHDVLGAKQADLYPVWLCPDPRQAEVPPGTGRIRSLEELPDLLQSLLD